MGNRLVKGKCVKNAQRAWQRGERIDRSNDNEKNRPLESFYTLGEYRAFTCRNAHADERRNPENPY